MNGPISNPDPAPVRATAAQALQLAKLVAALNDNVMTSNEAIALSNEAIAASDARIAELTVASRSIDRYVRRNRMLIRCLVAAMVAGILGAIVLAFVTNAALDAGHDAKRATAALVVQSEINEANITQNEANAVAACESSNESRLKVIGVWEFFVGLAAPAPPPEQQVKIDTLLDYVRTTYAPKPC